jgi:hypothetical protein
MSMSLELLVSELESLVSELESLELESSDEKDDDDEDVEERKDNDKRLERENPSRFQSRLTYSPPQFRVHCRVLQVHFQFHIRTPLKTAFDLTIVG